MSQQEQNILKYIEEELEKVSSLQGLGSAYQAQGRFDDARQRYLEVIQTLDGIRRDFQQTGVTEQAFAAYLRFLEAAKDSFSGLGNVSLSLGQEEDAANFFKEAAGFLHQKGNAYLTSSRLNEALELYKEEEEIGKEVNDSFIQARALLSLADTYKALGKYIEAIETYERSFNQWDENNPVERSRCRNEVGFIYYIVNKNDEAIKNYSEAWNITQATSNSNENFYLRFQGGRALRGLGDVYERLNEYLEALKNYEQAKNVFEEIAEQIETRSELAWTLLGIGSVAIYSDMRSESAVSNLEKSRDIFGKIDERAGEAEAENRLGNVLCQDNQLARKHYNRSVKLYDKSDNQQGKSAPLHNLGLIASKEKRYKKATNLLQLSLKISSGSQPTLEAKTRHCLCNAYKGWGEQYFDESQYGEAVKRLEFSLNFFNSIDPQFRIEQEQESDQKLEEQAQKKLAEAYRKLGDSYVVRGQQEYEKEKYENAIREWLEAKEAFKRINSSFRTKVEQEADFAAISNVEKKLEEAEKELIEARRVSSQINRKKGNYQAEIESLNVLWKIMRKLDNRIEEANALLGLGDIYHATGNYGNPDLSLRESEEEPANASEAYRRALKIYERINNPDGKLGKAKVLIGLGKTYHSLGQCQRALEFLGKGGI